jgi:hypothetical protein
VQKRSGGNGGAIRGGMAPFVLSALGVGGSPEGVERAGRPPTALAPRGSASATGGTGEELLLVLADLQSAGRPGRLSVRLYPPTLAVSLTGNPLALKQARGVRARSGQVAYPRAPLSWSLALMIVII